MSQIEGIPLTDAHIGAWVTYWPKDEIGRIKRWAGSLVYVVYNCDGDWDNYDKYTAAATHHKALRFKEADAGQMPMFPNEIP